MIESACSCWFINEDEFHFFLVCPLYNKPRVTLLNALAYIEPSNDNFELEEKHDYYN